MHRVANVEKLSWLLLGGYAGLLDEIHISLRAAVAYWRFVGTHFHNGVVHAHRREHSQHVLDCVHANGSLADCRGALDCLQIFDRATKSARDPFACTQSSTCW